VVGDALWIVVPVAACAGMLWLAHRMEPHWASDDGRRFLTTLQVTDRHGRPLERRKEIRVSVAPDGTLHLARRRLLRHDVTQPFQVIGRLTPPPRGKAVYVLDTIPPDAGGTQVQLRLPAGSRAVPVLDQVLADQAS